MHPWSQTPFIGEAYSSLSNSSSWILVIDNPIPLPSYLSALYFLGPATVSSLKCANSKHVYTQINSSSTVGDCSLILSSALRPLPLSRFSPGAAQTLSPLLYPPHHLSWCCVFCPSLMHTTMWTRLSQSQPCPCVDRILCTPYLMGQGSGVRVRKVSLLPFHPPECLLALSLPLGP